MDTFLVMCHKMPAQIYWHFTHRQSSFIDVLAVRPIQSIKDFPPHISIELANYLFYTVDNLTQLYIFIIRLVKLLQKRIRRRLRM